MTKPFKLVPRGWQGRWKDRTNSLPCYGKQGRFFFGLGALQLAK